MIIVEVKLASAVTGRTTVLGRMVINNMMTNKNPKRGDYRIRVGKRGAPIDRVMSKPQREARMYDFPRHSYSIWRLVLRALKHAYPEET